MDNNYIKWCSTVLFIAKLLQLCLTLWDPMDCNPIGSSLRGIFSGQNTEMGCCALLQGIFRTQGSNPHLLHLLHWQMGTVPLGPPGKPTTIYIYIYRLLFFFLLYHAVCGILVPLPEIELPSAVKALSFNHWKWKSKSWATPTRLTTIKKTDNNNKCLWGCGEWDPHTLLVGT